MLGTEDLLGVHQLHRPRHNGLVDMASFRPACLWKVSRRHLTWRSFEEEDVEKGDRGEEGDGLPLQGTYLASAGISFT